MPYVAQCRIAIKTNNIDEFEKFVNALRKDYGNLNVRSLPSDVDIDFDLSIQKESDIELGYDYEVDDED